MCVRKLPIRRISKSTSAGRRLTTREDEREHSNARVSTRYARGKIRIPYGTPWTFAMGIEPESVLDGKR